MRAARVVLAAALAAVPAAAAEPLRFLRDGVEVKRLDVATLAASCAIETVEVDDPNVGRRMRYRACPLRTALRLGFGTDDVGPDVLLRARDGYERPTTGAQLREPGGWLAIGDADRSRDGELRWAPVGRRGLDPGPWYVVWTTGGPHHPWPYQLAAIDVVDLAVRFAHATHTGAPDGGAAWRGWTIFRERCIACHAINGTGGRIGPDLNVPQSIVEYRPVAQIKAYVRDPATFRYGNMPANPDLTAADLDALVAYFEAMKRRKHDPGPR